MHRRPVESAAWCARFAAEEDVVRNGQIGYEIQLLMDHGDSQVLGVARMVNACRRAVDLDLPAVLGESAGQHVHQRRFPGSVLAEQGMHLPAADGQVYPVERAHTGKGLGDVVHLQGDGVHGQPLRVRSK